MKIENDKYYTNSDLSIKLTEFTLDFIGRDNIDTIIEPSAGDGGFSNYLFDKYGDKYNIKAYDILPEEDRIIKQNFLNIIPVYNSKCLILGNPPFSILKPFFNQCFEIGEYIAFILPISMEDNSNTYITFKYDLIHSENLGVIKYSGRDIHCCFNIYKRPSILNKYKKYKTNKFELFTDSKQLTDYDFKVQRLGENIGKICGDTIKSFYYVKLNTTDTELIDKIKNVFNTYNWLSIKTFVSIPYLGSNDIYKVLIQEIPELQDNKIKQLFNF